MTNNSALLTLVWVFALLPFSCSEGDGDDTSGESDSDTDTDTDVDTDTDSDTDNSEIVIDGYQLLIDGAAFQIQGVCWNPVPEGETHPDGLDYEGFAPIDIPLMQAAGINTIRTYEPLTDQSVLDQFHEANIYVLNSIYPYGGVSVETVTEHVNAVKDHPAILMWVLGNEWNYNGLYVGMSHEECIATLNQAASLILEEDASHPIATVYGEMPSSETVGAMPDIDIWGINTYRGISFGDVFSTWEATSEKPLFISEYGADAYNVLIKDYDPKSQAVATEALTLEILDNSSALTEDGVCLGGTIFEFADEWWKAGNPDVQDTGGVAPGSGPYPDDVFNEEWWGIVDINRVTRPAYDSLAAIYAKQP